MSESGKTAFVTGGASGIGRAVTEMLVQKGVKVYVADINLAGAEAIAADLNRDTHLATAVEINVASWDSQLAAFERAVADLGRIDYVFAIAGIGEKVFIPRDPPSGGKGFTKPNLAVLDADLDGVLYTAGLAIQQFRRQERDREGFRGKILCTASVCGFYCVPTLPVYTAAKHGVTGFVRSYGKFLPSEHITLNAISPNVVRTSISSDAFYEQCESESLIAPMKSVIDAFESVLGTSNTSGEVLEIGPKGGFVRRAPAEYLDRESERVCELLDGRGMTLQK